MQEPEERPGLPLWLPEPYHGPRPPGGFPQPRKPKTKPAGPLEPAVTIRVLAVVVGAVFVTVIILMTIIVASGY
jgi:hypothetical protein